MLSLEEIKEWADTVGAQSTSNLIKFCHNPAKPAHRAVTEIVFADGVDEYRVWIFREFNIIYVDALQQLEQEGFEIQSEDIARLSPLVFEHITSWDATPFHFQKP
jgi:hypothetical protein